MGKQVAARLNSKHKMFALEEIKDFFADILLHIERASRVRRPGANLFQQGSVVLIKLVLPVIRGFKELRLLMTDKDSVRKLRSNFEWLCKAETVCTLKTSYRDKY